MINQTGGVSFLDFMLNIGNTTDQTINTVLSTVNDSAITVISNTTNATKLSGSNSQIIKLKCNPPSDTLLNVADRMYSKCRETKGGDGCNDLVLKMTTCDFSNINQKQLITWNSKIKIESETQNKFQTNIENELKKRVDDSTLGFGKALNTVADGIANSSAIKSNIGIGNTANTTENIRNELINKFAATFTTNRANTLVSQFENSQFISIEGSGNVSGTYITQEMTANITMDFMSQQNDYNDIVTNIKAGLDNKKESTMGIGAAIAAIVLFILCCSCCLSSLASLGGGLYYSAKQAPAIIKEARGFR
jgi:hypothetical protein